MIHSKKDYAGTPIYAFKNKDGGTVFIPNDLGTVHEYIKAIQERQFDDDSICGAV